MYKPEKPTTLEFAERNQLQEQITKAPETIQDQQKSQTLRALDQNSQKFFELQEKIKNYYIFRIKSEIENLAENYEHQTGKPLNPSLKQKIIDYLIEIFGPKINFDYRITISIMDFLINAIINNETETLKILETKITELIDKKSNQSEIIHHFTVFEIAKEYILKNPIALELFQKEWKHLSSQSAENLFDLESFKFRVETFKSGGQAKINFLNAYHQIHLNRVEWMKAIEKHLWEKDAERFIKENLDETREFKTSNDQVVKTQIAGRFITSMRPFFQNEIELFNLFCEKTNNFTSEQKKALQIFAKNCDFDPNSIQQYLTNPPN